MPYLAQSSMVPQASQDVFERFLNAPSVVSLNQDGATLCYWVEGELQAGSRVNYRLQVGFHQYTWYGTLQPFSSPSKLWVILGEGPFTHFHGHHFVEDFKGRTIIRDELEFMTDDDELGKILDSEIAVNHALDHRDSQSMKSTQQIQILGQDIA